MMKNSARLSVPAARAGPKEIFGEGLKPWLKLVCNIRPTKGAKNSLQHLKVAEIADIAEAGIVDNILVMTGRPGCLRNIGSLLPRDRH